MFEIFPDQPVYEFPTFVNVAYAMIWSFVLACLVAITHRITFKGKQYSTNFFQALILGSIVTSMVMMAVGDSLARGLGVFGAMAIIRFRTVINDPRNVLFLFATLCIGLAIGVYGYTIAFVGTIIFCIVALMLHFSPFTINGEKGRLNFTLSKIAELPAILSMIKEYCEELHNTSMTVTSSTPESPQTIKYQYLLSFKKGADRNELLDRLRSNEDVTQLKIFEDDDFS